MKYSTIAVAAFVAVASAQADISIIPACAIPCIDEAAAKASKCEAKDFKCICTNVEAIVPAATTCVLAECGNAVALNEVLPATETFCKAVLAGGDTPEPSSTVSEPEPTSSAPVESSAEPSSVTTASASDSTSAPAVSSYPASSVTTSVVPTSAAPTTSAPASTSPVTAGAAGVAGSFGLLLLGAFAAL